jgi:alcohol dehydrogenase class IV
MVEFEFSPRFPEKTVCAPGTVSRLPEFVGEGSGPVLVVSDRGLARLGLPERIQAVLEGAGRRVTLFADLAGEPTLADLEACRIQAEQAGAQAVVGLGGGSVMDTAKAVAALVGSGQETGAVLGTDLVARRSLPLVLVPTTAGTGAEATPNALFIDAARRRKVAIVSIHLLPDVALLDASLTLGLPAAVTAATGLDALTHAVESYLSRRANPVSQALSAGAVALAAGALDRAVAHGEDLGARSAMLSASFLGGTALTIAGTGAVHALAYSLGSRGVPHGVANGLLLPYVMRFNAPACEAELAQLSAVVGQDVLDWLAALVQRMPIPHTLADLQIAATEIPAMAEESLEHTRLLKNNPREWSAETARAVLEQVR